MAKYSVTYACEHTGRVDLIGPYKQREYRLERLATEVCEDCKLAAAQERATAASTAAAAAGIPVLVGTPKQVAWAATIRQEYLDEVLCGVADNVIEREARASWWIDNRYAISDAVNRVRRAAIAQAAKGSN